MTLFLLVFRALQFWKYQLVAMKTDDGIFFVGVGERKEMEKFQKILDAKYLEHIQQLINKHG